MLSDISITWTLYGPLLFSIVGLVEIFLVNKNDMGTVTFKPLGPLFSFAEFRIPFNVWAFRSILALITLVSALSLTLMDYSDIFPTDLRMDVFYDEPGIVEALSQFDDAERSSLGIPDNYQQFQTQYYQDLDAEVMRILGISQYFYMNHGSIHSSGRTTFRVSRISGIQKYHITEAQGELLHTLELPNELPKQFKTFFEKLITKDDYISPTLPHLITHPSVILKPQFKQYLAQNMKAEGVLFHHTVIGVTKVIIYPWPDFTNTIYFAKNASGGLVPIAYAIYQ